MPTIVPLADSPFPKAQPANWTIAQVLEKIRIDAMVDTYADPQASAMRVAQMEPFVRRLHAALGDLRSDNPQVAGRGVRASMKEMMDAGLTEAQAYGYLNSQLISDAALIAGGLVPEKVNPERMVKSLIPAITGTDQEAATNALKRAIDILIHNRGLKGPEPYYHWLARNVKNDNVLRGAGIDPEEMRRATAPGDPHPDVAALLDISRTMMGAMLRSDPTIGDQNAATAIAAFNRFNGTTVALPAALTAPGGDTLTVRQLLALPIRA